MQSINTNIGWPMAMFPWVGLFAAVIIHISFTIGVVLSIRRLRENGRQPWFVGTEVWALATLFGGVFVAAIYWLIHHSTLSKE